MPTPSDARHGAPPPAASYSVHQRIWKVSSTLDRLSLLCEQHKLQTKHVDGKLDWSIPSVAAGLPTRDHVHVPSNFAWNVDTKLAPSTNAPRSATDQRTSVDAVADIAGDLDTAVPPTTQRNEESIDVPVLSVQSPGESPSLIKQQPPPPHNTQIERTTPRFLGDIGGRTMDAGFTELPRRRKVHFAEQERSYRGVRSKKMSDDLTYHEAVNAVRPLPAHYAMRKPDVTSATTFHQTYQPHLDRPRPSIVKRRGDLRAKMETRYEGRRILTAEDAMQVASEAARQFLKRPDAVEIVDNQPEPSTQRVDAIARKDDAELPVVANQPSIRPPQEETKQDTHWQPVEANEASPELAKSILVENTTQTEPPLGPPHVITVPTKDVVVDHPCSHCGGTGREPVAPTVATMSIATPPTRVNPARSTAATKPSKTSTAPRQVPQQPAPSVDVSVQPKQNAAIARTTRPVRAVGPRDHFNPILANARYPPEPPTFRAKSTYATDFPAKRSLQR